LWQYEVYADIRGGSLERGRQTTAELSKTAIFSTLSPYFSEALEVRPTLLYAVNRGNSVLPGNFEQKLEQ